MNKIYRTRTNQITYTNKYTEKTTALLFCIFLIFLPIADNACRNFLLGKELLISCTLLFCSILYASTITSKWLVSRIQKFITVSYADILIILYTLILICNSGKNNGIALIPVEEWCAILAGYLLMRNVRYANMIPEILIIAGTIQSAIAIFQKTGYVRSNHEWFEVTGSFGNPGPLGGFLAICIVICLCRIYETGKQNRTLRNTYIAGAGLTITAFYLADSRAAFIATIAGCIFFFFQKTVSFLKKHPIIILIITGIIIFLSIFIFNYREDSANGRLLIWKVCSEMICLKPVSGYGTGAFGMDYMLHQAYYFETHPGSRFSTIAGDVIYPYNEFLRILVELGIPGLLVITAFLGSLFLHKSKNVTQRILKAALLTYLFFSLFSYPNSVFPLFFLFAVLSGCIECHRIFTIPVSSFTTGNILILSVLICFISIREIRFYYEGTKILEGFFTENNKNAVSFSNLHYNRLKYCEPFNNIYRAWLEKHPDTKNLLKLPPSCNSYCYTGNAYMNSKQYILAEKYLKTASFMVPGRITPNYLLWQNTLQKGDTAAAVTIANRILQQPLKAEGTFTLRAKSEIRRFLEYRKVEENKP